MVLLFSIRPIDSLKEGDRLDAEETILPEVGIFHEHGTDLGRDNVARVGGEMRSVEDDLVPHELVVAAIP